VADACGDRGGGRNTVFNDGPEQPQPAWQLGRRTGCRHALREMAAFNTGGALG
jgi:hypothetical protein